MRKTIILRDSQDDFVQIQMQEDFKDSVKYLPPQYKELIETRHKPPSDELEMQE